MFGNVHNAKRITDHTAPDTFKRGKLMSKNIDQNKVYWVISAKEAADFSTKLRRSNYIWSPL